MSESVNLTEEQRRVLVEIERGSHDQQVLRTPHDDVAVARLLTAAPPLAQRDPYDLKRLLLTVAGREALAAPQEAQK